MTIRGGQQLIVLSPFLDSLGHFGLKNVGLPPGTGLGCFQRSQDVVGEFLNYAKYPNFEGVFYSYFLLAKNHYFQDFLYIVAFGSK